MKKPLRIGSKESYDVIVCGAGHAGCEAALAAARLGADTLLLTGNLDTIAAMSCNPAIGGQAKGQIVGEIDALGGAMAVNADTTAIQFRQLNASKGPAVRAHRAQCDKKAYQFRMKHVLELQEHLAIFQALVEGLIVENGRLVGVRTGLGVDFYGKTVVVTTGTFLRALMHIGSNKTEGGRLGDFSAKTLSGSLASVGIELERLKTGTPPRILGGSIDFSRCEEQGGDPEPAFFAFYDTRGEEDLFHVEQPGQCFQGWKPGSVQLSCWVTQTTEATRALVAANLKRSALYGGEVTGTGPRYCPSIEDKFVKFAGRETHRLYLEPEGIHTDEWYINGLSTSLPFDVQQELVRSVRGLERAVMVRPAYAVEYDFAPPTQLFSSLESKKLENLFLAGQINGTSGYEEAAGQGLIAGVNAVNKLRGRPPMILGRHEAYIGVLIDDLVTKGTREPYRMFTSRAEFRLLFNHGSAEARLFAHATANGLLPAERKGRIAAKLARIERWTQWLETRTTAGGTWADAWRRGDGKNTLPKPPGYEGEVNGAEHAEILYRIRYKGYLEREQRHIEKLQKIEHIRIPETFDYAGISGLRLESQQKLAAIRPATLGQAARISGVSPADISVLMVLLRARG